MIYLLDTNICIYLLNGNAKLQNKIEKIGVQSIGITYAVLAELYFGAFNSQNVKKRYIVKQFFIPGIFRYVPVEALKLCIIE